MKEIAYWIGSKGERISLFLFGNALAQGTKDGKLLTSIRGMNFILNASVTAQAWVKNLTEYGFQTAEGGLIPVAKELLSFASEYRIIYIYDKPYGVSGYGALDKSIKCTDVHSIYGYDTLEFFETEADMKAYIKNKPSIPDVVAPPIAPPNIETLLPENFNNSHVEQPDENGLPMGMRCYYDVTTGEAVVSVKSVNGMCQIWNGSNWQDAKRLTYNGKAWLMGVKFKSADRNLVVKARSWQGAKEYSEIRSLEINKVASTNEMNVGKYDFGNFHKANLPIKGIYFSGGVDGIGVGVWGFKVYGVDNVQIRVWAKGWDDVWKHSGWSASGQGISGGQKGYFYCQVSADNGNSYDVFRVCPFSTGGHQSDMTTFTNIATGQVFASCHFGNPEFMSELKFNGKTVKSNSFNGETFPELGISQTTDASYCFDGQEFLKVKLVIE